MAAIRIGTSERGGTFWTQGEAIAALLSRDHGLKCEVLDAGQASIENARRLDNDEIDFGFMASNWIGRAFAGDAPFSEPVDIRMAAPANAGAMFFITGADSELTTVRDMIGKRVAIGPEGSGMVQHIHTIFGALGINFSEFTPLFMSFEEGGKALESGDIDAQWQCPYPNAVMKDISERMDVRVLEYSKDDIKTVLDQAGFYRHATMPAGFFRGVDKPTEQLAVVNIIATHARTDDKMVRALVAAILDNFDDLANANPLFSGLKEIFEPLKIDGVKALEFGGTPLHPGAIQTYKDAGYLK